MGQHLALEDETGTAVLILYFRDMGPATKMVGAVFDKLARLFLVARHDGHHFIKALVRSLKAQGPAMNGAVVVPEHGGSPVVDEFMEEVARNADGP